MKLKSITNEIEKLFKQYSAAMADGDIQKFTGYFYIILTLSTVSFFGLFAIAPTLNTVSNLDKQYRDNTVVYEALSKKLTNLALLDSHYQTIQPEIDKIYSAIPKTSGIPKLTRQLENLAAANNLTTTKLNFGPVEIYPNVKREPMYSFTFTIEVSGTESEVSNFIADAINFDRIVGIDRIQSGIDAQHQYTTSLTGRVFFAPY